MRNKKSKRDWLQFWKRHDCSGQESALWRAAPVGILEFTERFLGRTDLSDFHRDVLLAFAGQDPQQWDERFKVLALCWGMGAGKNFTAEILVAYTLYRLMLLTDPRAFFGFGKAASGFIDILNISFVNETQAKQIFFDRMKEVIHSTTNPETGKNWFEEHGVDLRRRGVGDVKEKIIRLPNRVRVRCLPFTEVGFEGSDILLAIIDEPSRAVGSLADNDRAHRLFDRMLQNTTTRYQRKGKLLLFSYPEAADGDLIMELFDRAGTQFSKRGRHENASGFQDHYASKGATYEVNPRAKYEDFENLRESNPASAEAHIDCNPPVSKTGFYRVCPEKVRNCFNIELKYAAFEYEVVPLTQSVQRKSSLVSSTYTGIKLIKAMGDDEVRVLGGDASLTHDCFSLAFARAYSMEKSIDLPIVQLAGYARKTRSLTQYVDVGIVVDGIVEIQPIKARQVDPITGRSEMVTYPISLHSVLEFILQLKSHFPNFYAAAFDRWNTAQLLEQLDRHGIDARSWTFSAEEQFALYDQHRTLVCNDMFRSIPSPTSIGDTPRAEGEFLDLQEVIPGHKVDHKPGGSKDTSDAIVIASKLMVDHASRGKSFYLGFR